MKNYQAKTLIDGYKLGKQFGGRVMVGVPLHSLSTYEETVVRYGNKNLVIKARQKPLATQSFPDKFGRGFYTLAYFDWNNIPFEEKKTERREKKDVSRQLTLTM